MTRLIGDGTDAWLVQAAPEELLVAYADKRAGQRLETMDARFTGWRRRYPDGWGDREERAARARADVLERDVCALAGVAPGDVRRLRWTGPALRAARAATAGAAR